MDNNENMVVKKEKGSNGKNIIIIILVFIIALLLGIMLGQYISNNSKTIENNSSEITKDNTTTNNTKEDENTDSTQKTDEEIVKELFIEDLKNSDEAFEEYSIDKIAIQTGEDRKALVDMYSSDNMNITDKDIFTYVTYSIKPKNIENTSWIAGNGVVEDGWVKGKLACVHITYQNGEYKIQSVGTGW